MLIREARPEEYDAIGELTASTYRSLLNGGELGDYEDELRDVEGRAASSTVLVALDGTTLLGAVAYVAGPGTPMSEFTERDACGIRMLVVDPAHGGRGVGRALTDACLQLGRDQGRARVLLHSTEAMAVARAMYEKMGFARTTSRDVVVDTPRGPLLLMAYELALR